ncbi:hypothetical protein E2562_038329 [Oryza meyeriana var. granulata]|uniref:Uncharacterized protein n=1 Tax=Oryza meyeriana var. granulata TaxID=110450 RepID=A0A6G1CM22_9ORYZ|nr:hypothetical protein E2562_038329 [Oryza meyeriana var. granulata]
MGKSGTTGDSPQVQCQGDPGAHVRDGPRVDADPGDEVVESVVTAELLGSQAPAPRGARWTPGTRRGPTNVLRVQGPLRSQKPRPPPSPPRVTMTRRMAHNAEAGGSGQPRSWETPATLGPESRTVDPEGQPRPGRGAHSPPTKKKKTVLAPEGRPFAGPAKSSGAPGALEARETEGATAAPPDANLSQCEAPAPEDVMPYHRGEVGQPPIPPPPLHGRNAVLGVEAVSWALMRLRFCPHDFSGAGTSSRPGPRESFPEVLVSAQDAVERLRAVAISEQVELNEKRSVLAAKGDRLEEEHQKLESHVHAAKAVYDRDVVEVEVEEGPGYGARRGYRREGRSRKGAGLKSQQALFDAFKARACARIQQVEDRELELARREGAMAKQEAAIARREEATRASEARQLQAS